MGRNIVVCCDGTANQFTKNNTNVVKLYAGLIDDPDRQVIFYHPGVGTWEAPGALTDCAKRRTILAGQALGYGLESDIAAAYAFVMNNYRPSEGDRLFMFGFSRGAYTVRAVASLLYLFGVMRPGHETSIPYAIRLMNLIGQGKHPSREDFAVIAKFKETFSVNDAQIHFVGVWDTVSSVGWYSNPLHVAYATSNPIIANGCHAISIDEHRAFFRQNRWIPNPDPKVAGPKNLKQVWFAGGHCDVGGGYAEEESGLAKIALQWMFKEAEDKGLLVDPVRRDAIIGLGQGPNPNGKMHDELELHPWWKIAEYVPKKHFNSQTRLYEKRCNRSRPRTIPAGALIHKSVFERANYKPPIPNDHHVSD